MTYLWACCQPFIVRYHITKLPWSTGWSINQLVSTPASEKCGLDPTELNYVIVLTADSMILKYGDLNNLYANDEKSDKAIFEWHYAYIRRYGIVSGFFSFEAGRKCPSGEGNDPDFLNNRDPTDITHCCKILNKGDQVHSSQCSLLLVR